MSILTIEQQKYLRIIRPYKSMGISTIYKLWKPKGDIHTMHVEAIGLFIALGHKTENWNDWVNKHFRNNRYARKGFEFEGQPEENFCVSVLTFRITAEFAKHIAMVDDTDSSQKVINYLDICLCHWVIIKKNFTDGYFQNLKLLGRGGLYNQFKFWEGDPQEFIEQVQGGCLEAVEKYNAERVKVHDIKIG